MTNKDEELYQQLSSRQRNVFLNYSLQAQCLIGKKAHGMHSSMYIQDSDFMDDGSTKHKRKETRTEIGMVSSFRDITDLKTFVRQIMQFPSYQVIEQCGILVEELMIH